MKEHRNQPTTRRRLAVAVRGIVQGVGFRPFVYNAARSRGLAGWVANQIDTVRIEVQGDSSQLDPFLETLRNDLPPQACIDSIEVADIACQDGPCDEFEIRTSDEGTAARPTIPPDLATCEACLAEIRDPQQRRYGYPMTNCTNCGPRWSIIERLPYDRPRTSMARFVMCDDCQAEYDDPTDRRFHAQPIACPRCGPTLSLLDTGGKETHAGDEALSAAAEALRSGRIVAIKGLGGFQLLVDATDPEAVDLLRQRKRRPDKPLALMFSSLEEVRQRCHVSDEEAQVLSSHQAPILLLRRQTASDDLAEAVAPANPYLGVMLAYSPLHHLLMDEVDRPVVCTSGNLSEEPMAIRTGDALARLGSIADVLLTHNRPIVRPVDDSVARIVEETGNLQVLRRARGYAPLPIELGFAAPTILATGGHLKNTVALSLESDRPPVILSPHVGDLDDLLSVEVHRKAVADLVDFFDAAPQAVACDLHPDYASTRHAEGLAAEWGVPLLRVQHHHAHVAACMAENDLEGPVLGFAWDGTGYGPDGTVWGGEALLCVQGNFTRAAHLRTFALPGGDRAVREPRRSALGLLFEFMGEEAAEYVDADWFSESELGTLLSLLKRSIHSPRTSSMGRLFDAVAALCGLSTAISFEGQAAMALQFAADPSEETAYPLPLSDGEPAVVDWEPMVRSVLADRKAGVPIGQISARFHNGLAEMSTAVARRCGCKQVVLSGGCFQNALLAARVRARLLDSGFLVYTHHRVPPGDGGIALGQLFVAAKIQGASHVSGHSR